MAKGYIHRAYQFVALDFAGFRDGRLWTRFVVSPGPLTYPIDIPESVDGVQHLISAQLYESWQRTFRDIVEEATNQFALARAGDKSQAVIRSLRERVDEANANAWAPERPTLIRSRPPS